MFMKQFIEIAANIGSINTKGLKGLFNKLIKMKYKTKLFSQIDTVTKKCISNEEIEEFIKCMASVRGVNAYNPNSEIIRMSMHDGYRINLKTPTCASFYYDIDGKSVEIRYEDGSVTPGIIADGYIENGSLDNDDNFEYINPRYVISDIINKEMKYVCGQIMNKQEVEYVYGL